MLDLYDRLDDVCDLPFQQQNEIYKSIIAEQKEELEQMYDLFSVAHEQLNYELDPKERKKNEKELKQIIQNLDNFRQYLGNLPVNVYVN